VTTVLPRASGRATPAAAALALGGLAMALLWIPFTLAHGPTSYNEERVVAGMDMIGWGFLLGVVPNLAVAAGLVVARAALSEGRRGSARALWVVVGALVASALMDLGFRALGPPFSLFLLAPATIALAVLARDRGIRTAWAFLATAYVAAIGVGLLPLELSDSFGGFRIFGLAAYVASGLGWVAVAGRVRAG
jgi:hypothetical protein